LKKREDHLVLLSFQVGGAFGIALDLDIHRAGISWSVFAGTS